MVAAWTLESASLSISALVAAIVGIVVLMLAIYVWVVTRERHRPLFK